MMGRIVELVMSFLRNGGNSSSRLASVGSVTVMALYIVADMTSRFACFLLSTLPPMFGYRAGICTGGMSETLVGYAIAGLVAISTAVTGYNAAKTVKLAKMPKPAEPETPPDAQ